MDRVPLTARRWRRLQRQLHTTRDARLYRRSVRSRVDVARCWHSGYVS